MESKPQQQDIVSWLKSRTYPEYPATPHRLDSARRRTRPEEGSNAVTEDWFKPAQSSAPRTPVNEMWTSDNHSPKTVLDLQKFSVGYGQCSVEKPIDKDRKRSQDSDIAVDNMWDDYGQCKYALFS